MLLPQLWVPTPFELLMITKHLSLFLPCQLLSKEGREMKACLCLCSSLGFVDECATIPTVFWTIGVIDGPRPIRSSQSGAYRSIHSEYSCDKVDI